MTHPRKSLRDATKARLEGMELGSVELTFEIARAQELQSKPDCRLVFGDISTPGESSSRADKDGNVDRVVELYISLSIDGDDPSVLQDELDAWAELIEDRLRTDPPARVCTLTSSTLERSSDEQGVKWLAFLDMQYEAKIFS